jgi:sigma-B regulation protein RsbU (phosphoserine phosphatase)
VSARALLKLDFPARPEALKDLRDALCPVLARQGLDGAAKDRLVLALNEAVANVIRHAYGNRGDGRIRLTLRRERGVLRFKLRDDAPGVDPAGIRPRDLSECRPGGLGINFIDETMDRWCLKPMRRGGNLLTMCKRVRPRRAPGGSG